MTRPCAARPVTRSNCVATSGARCAALPARCRSPKNSLPPTTAAFDHATPIQVKAALLGAIAYFVLPFDVVPDMLPLVGSPMMQRCW